MAEPAAMSEEVAHDDLCPVSQRTLKCTSALMKEDMPAAAIYAGANAVQSPTVCVLYGTVGGCVFHEPDRTLEHGREPRQL